MRSALASVLLLCAMGCGATSSSITPAMLDAAKRRSPGASEASLERGRAAFAKKCKECHTLPDPASKTADEWPGLVEKMGKMAELDAPARQDVLSYVLAVRDTSGR